MPYDDLIARDNVAALVPEQVSNLMLANLGDSGSAALRLGTRVPVATNQTRFPVLSALPLAYWVDGDTGLKQTTQAAWDNKYLHMEELATIIPIPENVLDDAGFDVWGYLRPLMEAAIARAFDAAVFFGDNAPASFPDDITSAAVGAGNAVTRGSATDVQGGLFGDYVDLLGKVWADGYTVTGGIGNPMLQALELQVRDQNGQPILRPAQMPSLAFTDMQGMWPTSDDIGEDVEAIVGDFRQLVVGVRRDMTYKLITEGVITDSDGAIVYNLPQQDMVALRLVFRAGWQVSNPINRQRPDENDRYPFAVLRSPAIVGGGPE
jgi:HK97 family phage major capsid protein